MSQPEFLLVGIISAACSVASLLVHYESLRVLWFMAPKLPLRPRQRILVVVGGALIAHILEIALFAMAFLLFCEFDEAASALGFSFEEAAYLSSESYASLGTSTGFPVGHLRLLAGTEALVGLILIGWTASFTYLVMCKFWEEP